MSEYKVTFEAVVRGFFSDTKVKDIKVVEADNAEDALSGARSLINQELSKHGLDPEEDGFHVNITDVSKIG